MFKSNTERLITTLIDQLLPRENRFGGVYQDDGSIHYDNAILLDLALEVKDPNMGYTEGESTRQYDEYFMVFCGNVSVFYAHKDGVGRQYIDIPSEEWVNTSNHDSCWRTDGLQWLSAVYFDMCKNCNPNVAPITLESDCRVGFMRLWDNVQVDIKRNNEDHHYNLINIKPKR